MTNLGLKILLIIPVIFIVDYMVMIMVACINHLFGLTYDFVSGGKIIMLISLIVFLIAIAPNFKQLFKKSLES